MYTTYIIWLKLVNGNMCVILTWLKWVKGNTHVVKVMLIWLVYVTWCTCLVVATTCNMTNSNMWPKLVTISTPLDKRSIIWLKAVNGAIY